MIEKKFRKSVKAWTEGSTKSWQVKILKFRKALFIKVMRKPLSTLEKVALLFLPSFMVRSFTLMSCFSLKPAETPQLEGDKDELNEYFTSQINREMKGIIYQQLSFTFPQKNKDDSFLENPHDYMSHIF